MTDITTDDIQAQLKEPWVQFVRLTAEHRPALFAFGLQLTGSPFDGEDLVQEAIVRGFGAAAVHDGSVGNLRSYLFRTMSNLWIDLQRRPGTDTLDAAAEPTTHDRDPTALHDASTTLFESLPPMERVAVVLHEACGFPHREVAAMLTTTEGAVRSALHRAKRRLRQDPAPAPRQVDVEVVDRFVEAFATADLSTIRSLLLDDVQATVFPYAGSGADQAMETGWVNGSLYHHHPGSEESQDPYPSRIERVEIAGCPVLAVERDGEDGMRLEEVWLLETVDGRVASIRDYCFSPQVVDYVGRDRNAHPRLLGYTFDDHPGAG